MLLLRVQINKVIDLKKKQDRNKKFVLEESINKLELDQLICLRNFIDLKPNKIINKFDATSRFDQMLTGKVGLYRASEDCSFFELLLWDIAHSLDIGAELYILFDQMSADFLKKDYYQSAFEIRREGSVFVFKKVAPLSVELEKGLGAWTFGIPTGPGDATILNKVVARILEIECEKEVILCGRPGDNFKYFDKVKIVGEDISAPPVQIARKKNEIVNHAKYHNIAIMHDRVYLPKDFYQKMCKFGDSFPLVTLQSFYFRDKQNFHYSRYSDLNTIIGFDDSLYSSFTEKGSLEETNQFGKSNFTVLEEHEFCYSNPACYIPKRTYPTGSLYIFKKSIWKIAPLDNTLKWAEFEDVEHGLRACRKGIPVKVNPFTFAQSVVSRPIVTIGGTTYHTSKLEKKHINARVNTLLFQLKPLLKVKKSQAKQNFIFFDKRYCSGRNLISKILPNNLNSAYNRFTLANELLNDIQILKTSKNIDNLISDYEKLIVCDQLTYKSIQNLKFLTSSLSAGTVKELKDNNQFRIQFMTGLFWSHFCDSHSDYFPKLSILNRIGSFISAIRIRNQKYKYCCVKDSVYGIYNTILNSTPYEKKK